MAPLRCAAKLDLFLSLDCAPPPCTLAQSKERKGSNFAIWQPWREKSTAGEGGTPKEREKGWQVESFLCGIEEGERERERRRNIEDSGREKEREYIEERGRKRGRNHTPSRASNRVDNVADR